MAYAREMIAARRVAPLEPDDDMTSGLLAARVNGEPLTDERILGIIRLLLSAGHSSTTISLGILIGHLAEHPDLQTRLRAEPALFHAHRCEAICRQFADELEDFDLPAMHEALARAHLVAGNREEALHRLRLARDLCAKIVDPEDRGIIEAQIDSIATAAA